MAGCGFKVGGQVCIEVWLSGGTAAGGGHVMRRGGVWSSGASRDGMDGRGDEEFFCCGGGDAYIRIG